MGGPLILQGYGFVQEGGWGSLLELLINSGLLFVQEGGLSIEPNYVEQFSELNQVLDALRRRDVEPALQ